MDFSATSSMTTLILEIHPYSLVMMSELIVDYYQTWRAQQLKLFIANGFHGYIIGFILSLTKTLFIKPITSFIEFFALTSVIQFYHML